MFGYAGAPVGDVDGDGYDDMLTGAYNVASVAGAAYVNFGPLSGNTSMVDADLVLTGEVAADYAGIALGRADDFDGDGYADFLVGAPGHDPGVNNAGTAYLILGPGYSGSLASADLRIDGDQIGGNAGWGTMGYADLDDDGSSDLVVGSNNAGALSQGAVFVFRGPLGGSLTVSDADMTLAGKSGSDMVGPVSAAVPDLDGSGATGLVIGASAADPVGSASGEVYLLYGLGL